MFRKFPSNIALIGILLIATFFRFTNLMWGDGNFFNPDERNMAGAISQFRLPKKPVEAFICITSEFSFTKIQVQQQNNQLTSQPVNQSTMCNLNPHFFAYGQFPLYLAFGSGIIYPQVLTSEPAPIQSGPDNQTTRQLNFPQAIFWLRFWSATTSVLTVFVVYKITKLLFEHLIVKNTKRIQDGLALTSAVLVTFTPGLIQSAHFGTTESMLTFFFMVIIYLSLKLIQSSIEKDSKESHLSVFKVSTAFAIIMGLALGTKISALAFVPPYFLALGAQTLTSLKSQHSFRQFLVSLFGYLNIWIFIIFITATVTILASPYNMMEIQDFRSAINYETAVAQGLKVFYTRQFENTLPIVFQHASIFPYALGPALFLLGTTGFLILKIQLIIALMKKFVTKNHSSFVIHHLSFVIILVTFLTYFLPTSMLYTKWTRFMNPTFPLFSIFAVYALYYAWKAINYLKFRTENHSSYPLSKRLFKYWFIGLSIGLGFHLVSPGIAYVRMYSEEDVRTTASRWIYKNVPSGTYILSETGNVIDIPTTFSQFAKQDLQPTDYTLNPVSFDFYQLDENPLLQTQLIEELEKAEYIFVPSRRLFANAMRISQELPISTTYYNALFTGALGFDEVATFTSFPSLYGDNHKPLKALDTVPYDQGIKNSVTAIGTFLTDGYLPDEGAEETWSVFDHPVIRIYKKARPLTRDQYESLILK